MTEPTATERPAVSITAAAELCLVHRRTIRRRLERGDLPNAYKDERTGEWRIPVTDLIASGLQPGKPSPPDPDTVTVPDSDATELARWKERALLAEQRADLLAESVADLRTALRAIAGPEPDATAVVGLDVTPTPPRPTPNAPERSSQPWWRFRRR